MTVQYLEEKIQDMESVQKTVLLRLENIEQLIRERDAEKQTEHTHEHSWYHHDDGFNDSEYWQSHTYYSSACPPSPYAQGTQPQYIPQLTSPVANTHLQYASPLMNTQPQFPSPLSSAQPQHTTPQYVPNSQDTTTNSLPKALPICLKPNATSLPSSEINKEGLQTTDTFFRSHRNLKGESKAGILAVRLAREVYFGTQVMSRCTVSGLRDLPGLPVAELSELKHTVFLQFPQFWQNAVEFEPLWSKCCDAINQSCKKLRQGKK